MEHYLDVRNNSFIPWDTDGDISIINNNINIHDFFSKIKKYIATKNYYLEKHSDSKYVLHYSKQNLLHIDISIRKEKNKVWYDSYPLWGISNTDLFPLKKSVFEDIDVFIPNNYIHYLNKGYGDNCIDKPRRQYCNECFKKDIFHIKFTKCPK
jgi:phosphorylcholine metabolism protein LicD